MRLKLFFILIFAGVISAQETRTDQGIELPDFVITGVQSVSIPTVDKPEPDIISTLSNEFFTPVHSPEEFNIVDLSAPLDMKLDLPTEAENLFNGEIKFGVGAYTLPVGHFIYNKSFPNVFLYSKIWGLNETEFVNNAGYNVSGGLINSDFFLSNQSTILPGAKISVGAKYYRDNYNFYGSVRPEIKRETENTLLEASLEKLNSPILDFGAGVKLNYFDLLHNDFSEKVLTLNGFGEYKMPFNSVFAKAKYISQSVKNDIFISEEENYFELEGGVKFKPMRSLNFMFGANISKNGDNSYFTPIASIKTKINDYLTFIGDFSPSGEFITARQLVDRNRFFIPDDQRNVFIKHKSDLKLALQYQYDKYYEISAGIGYRKSRNYPYFTDGLDLFSGQNYGLYQMAFLEEVKRYSAFVDALFHLGPFGQLYGEAELQDITDRFDNQIPYHPEITASAAYGYNFANGLNVKSELEYNSEVYTSLENSEKLPQSIDLSVSLGYNIYDNLMLTLDLQNILGRKNYFLRYYESKPFDIIAGVEYKF